MSTLLKCKLSPGQFRNELAASASSINGEFSMFIDRRDVIEGNGGTGLIKVSQVDRDSHRVLVLLPVNTLENGRTVVVTPSQLIEQ